MTNEKKDASIPTKPIPQMLFVQSAIKGTFRNNTLTFKPYAPALIYFSERPHRLAGHMTVKRYMEVWQQGKDSFKSDPPNAVLSILSDNATINATIELLEASTLGNAFQYKINIIEGVIPRNFGAASLFIDAFPTSVNNQVTDLSPHHEEPEIEEAAPTTVNPMITDAVTEQEEKEPVKAEIEEAAPTTVNPQVTDAVTGREEKEPEEAETEEAALTLGSLLYETVGHGLLTTAKNKATDGLATLFGPHSHHNIFTPKDKEEKEKE